MNANQHADTAAIDAATAIKAAEIATEAAASIPQPPPPPDPFLGVFAEFERTAFARILPRRNRWKDLLEFDTRLAEIEQQRNEAHQELSLLLAQRQEAEQRDKVALAEWLASGRQGERPESETQRSAERLKELQGELAGFAALVEKVAGEKVAYVQKHRRRFVKDAEAARDTARDKYVALVNQLADARSELQATGQTVIWALLYPHSSLQSEPPMHLLVGGRVKVLQETIGTPTALTVENVRRLLEADAEILGSARTVDQEAALRNVDARTLRGDAVWTDTDEGRARAREEKREALERYRREHGRDAPEWDG